MQSMLQDTIPATIDTFLQTWQQDESEQYRLTLLHKSRSSIYCFLSSSMQELIPEQNIPMGMTLAFSKKTKIQAHYGVVLHRKDIDGGYYYTFDSDSPLQEKDRVIPFRYENELPSVIVDKGLKQKLLDYITLQANFLLQGLEYVGEHGSLRTYFYAKFSKERKTKKKTLRGSGRSLRSTVEALLHEESSPSSFIQPSAYVEEDKGKKAIFVEEKMRKYLLLLIAFVPPSRLETQIMQAQDQYKSHFGESKQEEAQRLLSEFATGHPKAIEGLRGGIRLIKHTSNLSVYAIQLITTALAYKYAWRIISYPLIAASVASGLTMANNLIRSRGQDSSGIIATLIERAYFHKLE